MTTPWIERELTPILTKTARLFPIVALTGPRQSGKTSLIKRTFPKRPYVTLESLDTRHQAQTDPRGFLARFPNGAILDEAQRAPDLFSYLQEQVDAHPKPGQYILSGSQHFLLLESITQSLAGRVGVLELLPLSIKELQSFQPKLEIDTCMLQGFFPRTHTTAMDLDIWFQHYLRTYVERDVRSITQVAHLGLFQKFLKLCAGRCAQLLNYSSLAGEVGVSVNTIKSWISILKTSYIAFTLPPFYRNYNKRVTKSEKLFFYDTGLACALLGIEQLTHLHSHPLRGHLFENLIIADLMKQRLHQGKTSNLYFWRDQSGHEVDCIAEWGHQLIACEIKSAQTFHADMLKGLQRFATLSHASETRLIYAGQDAFSFKESTILPWDHAHMNL